MNYDIDNLTNRYDSVGGNALAYDAAGNLTTDKDGYQYKYDYENRITKIIKSGPTTVAEFAYDALGRRIKKVDSVAGTTNIYYHNDKWQVLSEYSGSNSPQRWYAYGNYIDEVLVTNTTTAMIFSKLYVHDHLFSPVALVQMYHLDLKERYEYDAYGNCYIMDASYNPRSSSLYGNPYYFTGRQLDELDGGNLKIQYNRNRYYDYYTGRFTTHDPLAVKLKLALGSVDLASMLSMFSIDTHQSPGFSLGPNLYEYADSNPTTLVDPHGLWGSDVHDDSTRRWSKQVGYGTGDCAWLLGYYCASVDDYYTIRHNRSPLPRLGDFRYHFDTDKRGDVYMPGARDERIAHHMRRADDVLRPATISYADVERGLMEVGVGLHPLQDKYSHNAEHLAATPLQHAPKEWCLWKGALGDPEHPLYVECLMQALLNPNWDDPRRPDRVSEWLTDYRKTRDATKSVLKDVLKYPCVCARCKLGLRW